MAGKTNISQFFEKHEEVLFACIPILFGPDLVGYISPELRALDRGSCGSGHWVNHTYCHL